MLSAATVAKYARIGALIGPAVYAVVSGGTNEDKLRRGLAMYSGFDIKNGTFSFPWLLKGWTPYLATSLLTKGVSKINGMIRRL